MIRVYATREGLVGKRTSSGWTISEAVPFVALPSVAALRLWVRVRNPATGRTCVAVVLDVGPWNTKDDAYVFQPATMPFGPGNVLEGVRPRAETHMDEFGRVTNSAGIDLGEAVWAALGMTDNGLVDWEFI